MSDTSRERRIRSEYEQSGRVPHPLTPQEEAAEAAIDAEAARMMAKNPEWTVASSCGAVFEG